MNISEETFEVWAKGPGKTEQQKCDNAETAVKKAINADADLAALDITVFPQGSFRARTNVPGDSDVDVCIRCNDSFIADYPPGKTRDDFGNTAAFLTFAEYRNMVEKALRGYFGDAQVVRGDKAFDVRENTYRLDADVIATFEHRRYTGRFNSDGSHHYLSGVAFRPDSGGTTKNWPQQNYDNGIAKNDACKRHYKRVVRILKTLCYKMRDEGIADAKNIGSFLIESLVWNAPNEAFNYDSYTRDVRSVLAHTFNNTLDDERCKEWGEVNELKYLFRSPQPWTRQQAHNFPERRLGLHRILMKNLRPRPFAFFFFGLFALCFAGIAVATGAPVTDIWAALKIAYKTVPVLLLIWAGFATYGWRWHVFRGWLVPFPDLDGTWQGSIQTTWKHPTTGETPGPIPVILTIKQSFMRVSCVMRTAEMTSRSYFADFWLDSDEQLRKLGYCYTSAPLPSVADRSQPHDGTMSFEIIGDPVEKLKGIYWTTRKTTGEVALTLRSSERLDEFPTDLGEHPMKGK